jgi:hypothetical protein
VLRRAVVLSVTAAAVVVAGPSVASAAAGGTSRTIDLFCDAGIGRLTVEVSGNGDFTPGRVLAPSAAGQVFVPVELTINGQPPTTLVKGSVGAHSPRRQVTCSFSRPGVSGTVTGFLSPA